MHLENVVFDAVDPQRLGRFWEAAVGSERLTDEPEGFETRITVEGGPVLDLCFQRVSEPSNPAPRLHLHLCAAGRQSEEVDRLLGLGARRLDIGQHDVPGAVLADPEGNPLWVLADRADDDSAPVAALHLDSADPDRDEAFWSWLTGWTHTPGDPPRGLRHPSHRGPVLHLQPERTRKATIKNRLHLDIRLESGDEPDDVAAGISARGGRELHPQWGALPWRLYADPSGNEFCVLPARS